MLISSGKTSRRIKKLFNLSGKNKRANARTFAQHMKTLNMVSVYLLVQPTSKSGGEAGEGASASSAPRGSTGDNNNTSNKQHNNVISTGESGVLNSSEQESNSETTKTGVVVPRTFKNSLSFEIRRVDGQVLMVDEVDEDDDDDYRQQQIEPTTMARNSDKDRFLGVDEVFSNGAISSSFNSTASSHIIDSPVCVSVAVSPSDNDVVKGQSLFCGCQSTADDNKLNQARSKKQICVSLENNSLLEEKSIYNSFFTLFNLYPI